MKTKFKNVNIKEICEIIKKVEDQDVSIKIKYERVGDYAKADMKIEFPKNKKRLDKL